MISPRSARRRLFVGTAAVALAATSLWGSVPAGAAATPRSFVAGTAAASSVRTTGHVVPRASNGTVHYAVSRPLCAQPKDPSTIRCFAQRRVDVAKGTPHARPYFVANSIGYGPNGGYTPDDIAKAYGVHPSAKVSQTVAVVNWYDDPKALKDLDTFDRNYHLPKETSKSFRKLNSKGKAKPLPEPDADSAGEISLDIQTVRGLCHHCKILLIEANASSDHKKGPSDAQLAKAENEAVKLHANEVSNSFGAPEAAESKSFRKAFDHKGVVITASTGDDGWYFWDDSNAGYASQNAPNYPSSDPHVVAVGGTTLTLNNDGTRLDEGVWNNNGEDDEYGSSPRGAGGGGCSTHFAAPSWQAHAAGFSAAGCHGKRLAADVSADADPATGLDVYDSYHADGWMTVGGTSLSSPLLAAMWALAGGAHKVDYPARTLYANAAKHPSRVFDVTEGGNGLCGGDTTTNCADAVSGASAGTTDNPNGLGAGQLDCSFPRDGSNVSTAPALSSECNAVPGYDGPTGLGTPKTVTLLRK